MSMKKDFIDILVPPFANRLKLLTYTVESRFLEPPEETQIGSINRRVREIGGKITVFD